MKHGGSDGLDENIRMHATAAFGDDEADGFGGGGAFDDDDDEVIVVMTSDDDGTPEDDADDLFESHAEEAIIVVAPPSPVSGYTPATTMSKPAVKSVAPPSGKKARCV